MFGCEAAVEKEAGGGDLFKNPVAVGAGVGYPGAEDLKVGLGERATAVIVFVHAEDSRSWHRECY